MSIELSVAWRRSSRMPNSRRWRSKSSRARPRAWRGAQNRKALLHTCECRTETNALLSAACALGDDAPGRSRNDSGVWRVRCRERRQRASGLVLARTITHAVTANERTARRSDQTKRDVHASDSNPSLRRDAGPESIRPAGGARPATSAWKRNYETAERPARLPEWERKRASSPPTSRADHEWVRGGDLSPGPPSPPRHAPSPARRERSRGRDRSTSRPRRRRSRSRSRDGSTRRSSPPPRSRRRSRPRSRSRSR
jgi:hypothetical protein